ncbi:unnamed protein product [Boreogadus saida]
MGYKDEVVAIFFVGLLQRCQKTTCTAAEGGAAGRLVLEEDGGETGGLTTTQVVKKSPPVHRHRLRFTSTENALK